MNIFTETLLHQPSIQSQGDDSTVDPQGFPRNLQQTTGTHLGQVIDNNKNVQCAVITFLCPTRMKKGNFGCFLAHILNYLNSSIPRFPTTNFIREPHQDMENILTKESQLFWLG